MLITSSRKPSAKTRILCKHLATFFNCEYVNRGKMGMREVMDLSQEPILIVGEFHGNPGSLAFYDQEGTCLLSIYISMSGFENTSYSKLKVIEPVIIGETELVNNISNILSIERAEDTNHTRYILVDDEKMEFFNSNELLLKILIKSFKEFP